ncbi:MAG: hypothetical protein GY809_30320 [Planctomycetes bacterium]|nr:hypothetical protein [Planctomycetota bacterium]
MNTSLWDMTHDSQVERHMDRVTAELFGDYKLPEPAKPLVHLGRGATVTLRPSVELNQKDSNPAAQYSQGDLSDGRLGLANHTDSAWLGFLGKSLLAEVDFDAPQTIKHVSVNVLQSEAVGIFLPEFVHVEVSHDGQHFHDAATVKKTISASKEGAFVRAFTLDMAEENVRSIHVTAKNIGVIPQWHKAKGKQAWLFVDEIIVK